MKRIIIYLIAGACLITCNSCLKEILCVEGDRYIVTEKRRVLSFDEIRNSTAFDVVFKEADTLGISITAEQNLLDYIETNVYEGCLEIRTSPGSICLDYHERPVLKISSPSLRKAVNSGSGTFVADRIKGELVTIKNTGSGDISAGITECNDFESIISGSGDVDVQSLICQNSDFYITGSGNLSVSGISGSLYLKISGSGSFYGRNLEANSASIIISGSGNSYVSVEEFLSGHISGSGNIYIKGDPEIEETLSGSGRIIKTK